MRAALGLALFLVLAFGRPHAAGAEEPEPDPATCAHVYECTEVEPAAFTAAFWCALFTLGLISGNALFSGSRG